jgi:transcription elongation factor Elf1
MSDGERPVMQWKVFTCPLCGQLTGVKTPMDFILLKWVTCEECNGEFLIENNQPKHQPYIS